jgi:hypothetical protein
MKTEKGWMRDPRPGLGKWEQRISLLFFSYFWERERERERERDRDRRLQNESMRKAIESTIHYTAFEDAKMLSVSETDYSSSW